MPYTFPTPNESSNLETRNNEMKNTIISLQRRLDIAEEGWKYSERALHELIRIIRNIDFNNPNSGPYFQSQLNGIYSIYTDEDSTDSDETDIENDTNIYQENSHEMIENYESNDDESNNEECDESVQCCMCQQRGNYIDLDHAYENGWFRSDYVDYCPEHAQIAIDNEDNYCYDENGVQHFAPHLNQIN